MIYTPTIEARWRPHRGEFARNHIALLGEVPKAIIFGLTLAVLLPFFLLGVVFAGLGWAVDLTRRVAR